MLVRIDGRIVAATVNGRRTGRASADSGTLARGIQAVIAPMPGRVVRVLVEAGAAVIHGQPLVVLEAMKMEHSIASPADGTVTEVLVQVGQQVETGQVLVVVEEPS
jgi:biotin carboxyl carrier protein